MADSREIGVFRAGNELIRQSLELLRLPGGATGAKWGGLVFPLRDDGSIDVMDTGTPPGHCNSLVEPAARWQLSTGHAGAGAYLFLDGSAQACSRTVGRLEESGIRVLRSGPNLSGSAGDWFIRLDALADGDQERIGTLLESMEQIDLVEEDTNLRERLLVQALATAQASHAELRRELDRARSTVTARPAKTDEEHALRRNLDDLSQRLAEAQAESEALRARMEAAPRAAPKANRLEAELAAAAVGLLPRIDLIAGSMNFIAVELPSRTTLWKALADLDRQDRGQPTGWKSLSGHAGWWERHFSTGQDNQGRIYARLSGQPARWQVLVSHKQDQAQDLRRIGRM